MGKEGELCVGGGEKDRNESRETDKRTRNKRTEKLEVEKRRYKDKAMKRRKHEEKCNKMRWSRRQVLK